MSDSEEAMNYWNRALELWADENESEETREEAVELLRLAHRADPTFPEPLLGLHLLLPEERSDILEKIIPYADNLAEGAFFSFYKPLIWHPVPITNGTDLRRARAKDLLHQERFEEAEMQLQLCPDDLLTNIIRIDLLFRSEQYQHCLHCLQAISGAKEELDIELRIIKALVLKRIDLPLPALHLLKETEEELQGSQRLFVLYEEALLLLDMDQKDAARGVLEMIYAEDVAYRDVAKILGRESIDPVWEDLVSRLRSTDSRADDLLDSI